MKKFLIGILFLLNFCFGENIDLNTYLKSKEYLNSIVEFKTYVTANKETILGSNLISISLINVNGEKVSFQILKDEAIIITDCDFKITKYTNYFSINMDNSCNRYYTKNAQEQYMLDMLKSVEYKINFVYNKGEIK